MSSSMRSDCASIPTRGSRFVGLLSIIITRGSPLGLEEHPEIGRSRLMTTVEKTEKQKVGSIQDHVAPDVLVWAFAARRIRANTSHIRNLPQDCRTPRPSGRRNVRWPPMPRLVRKQRERRRLLGH